MLKIFISYSQEDIDLANKIESALKQYDLGLWIDKNQIRLGGFWLEEIDKGLSDCDFVLGVVTRNYLESGMARKEAYAGMSDDRFIPLFFESPSTLNLTPMFKLTQGVKFANRDFEEALQELITRITPPTKPADVYARIQGPSAVNPFRRVRAEFFDHDFLRLAGSYRKPRIENIDLATGRKPVFIRGGRGSGKTMVLKSLDVRTAVSLPADEGEPPIARSYRHAELDYFGIYIKSQRGCFSLSTPAELERLGVETVRRIFVNDFNLKVLYALVETLGDCSGQDRSTPILIIPADLEKRISETVARGVRPQSEHLPGTFGELLVWLHLEVAKLGEYVDRRAFGEAPEYQGCYTEPNSLDTIGGELLAIIPELKNSRFYVLIDEFENLLEYQQVILNTMLKTFLNIVLKVAVKFEGIYSYKTLVDQQLQQHDYGIIDLDFELATNHHNYADLLRRVTKALLKDAAYSQVDITKILDEPKSLEVSSDEMELAVKELLKRLAMTREQFREKYLDPPEVRFGPPLIFRILHKKRGRRKKQYAGFDTFLYLSSGIIRYFLELCGMAFYLAHMENPNFEKSPNITVAQQTRAAYTLSDYYLDMLANGLEEYGDAMQRLIVDIGEIARERLLHSKSEPEAIRIEIKDPQYLESPRAKELHEVLKTATRESVLHQSSTTGGFIQWSKYATRPREYIINRIYTPALQIGYGARHRLEFTSHELLALLDPKSRGDTKRKLQEKLRR